MPGPKVRHQINICFILNLIFKETKDKFTLHYIIVWILQQENTWLRFRMFWIDKWSINMCFDCCSSVCFEVDRGYTAWCWCLLLWFCFLKMKINTWKWIEQYFFLKYDWKIWFNLAKFSLIRNKRERKFGNFSIIIFHYNIQKRKKKNNDLVYLVVVDWFWDIWFSDAQRCRYFQRLYCCCWCHFPFFCCLNKVISIYSTCYCCCCCPCCC